MAGAPSTRPAPSAPEVTIPAPRTPRLEALARRDGPAAVAPVPVEPATVEPATEPVAAPTGEPELLAVRLIHRLARRDTRLLAAVADGLASGTSRFTEKRALAFGDWVERVCLEFAHHHELEDTVLWPLLEDHAGSAVDLSDLRGDHMALRSLLGEVRRRSRAVVAALVLRPSAVATARDFTAVRELASTLAELADLVSEHLAETERVALAALVAHVPRTAWAVTLDELRAGTPEPRLRAVADPEELAGLRAAHGRWRETGLRLSASRLRRREHLVYGVEDARSPTEGPVGPGAPPADGT